MRKIICYLFFLVGMISYAQFDFVTYQLRATLPQAMEENPAFVTSHKLNIAFIAPFFGVRLNANIPVGLGTILKQNGSQYNLDLTSYLKSTPMRSFLFSANVDLQILLVTLKTKIGDFAIGSNYRINANVGLNNDLLRLAWFGNTTTSTYSVSLKNTGVYGSAYVDNFIGYSTLLPIPNEQLRVGGRIHFLVAQAGAKTTIGSGIINTDKNNYEIRARIKDVYINSSGQNIPSDLNILKSPNYGAAIDLGAEYQLNSQWSFHASIVNLGFIRYTNDLNQYHINDIDTSVQGILINSLEALSKRAWGKFTAPNVKVIKSKGNPFTIMLPSKIYLGATWQFARRQRLDGVLSLYNIPALRLSIPGLMVGYDIQLGRMLNWAFNVSYNTYTSIAVGTGFTFNMGPVQLYCTLDNFWPAFNLPLTRSIDTRIGLQLQFDGLYKRTKKIGTNKNDNIEMPKTRDTFTIIYLSDLNIKDPISKQPHFTKKTRNHNTRHLPNLAFHTDNVFSNNHAPQPSIEEKPIPNHPDQNNIAAINISTLVEEKNKKQN